MKRNGERLIAADRLGRRRRASGHAPEPILAPVVLVRRALIFAGRTRAFFPGGRNGRRSGRNPGFRDALGKAVHRDRRDEE